MICPTRCRHLPKPRVRPSWAGDSPRKWQQVANDGAISKRNWRARPTREVDGRFRAEAKDVLDQCKQTK